MPPKVKSSQHLPRLEIPATYFIYFFQENTIEKVLVLSFGIRSVIWQQQRKTKAGSRPTRPPKSAPFLQRLGFIETSGLIRQHGVCFVPMRYTCKAQQRDQF